MTQLCIIRHGETDWNLQGRTQGAADVPLNEQGQRQARCVAAHLARQRWDAIYGSPLSRAFETARIIADAAELAPIHTDPRLAERDFGKAEGMDVHERRAHFRWGDIPGAESWDRVAERGLAAIHDIVRANPNARVLAVAHGGLIGGLLAELSGGELRPGRPSLGKCSMTMLEYDGRWRIAWYNRLAEDLEPDCEAPASRSG
jgi:broad specificity phosphatase PhoE